jgi:hypothetical protein
MTGMWVAMGGHAWGQGRESAPHHDGSAPVSRFTRLLRIIMIVLNRYNNAKQIRYLRCVASGSLASLVRQRRANSQTGAGPIAIRELKTPWPSGIDVPLRSSRRGPNSLRTLVAA